jgi:hypothetical protein
LELHAAECPECNLGIRALRALLRVLRGSVDRSDASAPAGIFDRVRAEAAGTEARAEETGEA